MTTAQTPNIQNNWAAFWLTAWQRKYRVLPNNQHIRKVFTRMLLADDRYQRENKMGKYALINPHEE